MSHRDDLIDVLTLYGLHDLAQQFAHFKEYVMAAIDDANTALANLDTEVRAIADTVSTLEGQVAAGSGSGGSQDEAIATLATGIQAAADNLSTIIASAGTTPTPAPTPAPEPVPAPEPPAPGA